MTGQQMLSLLSQLPPHAPFAHPKLDTLLVVHSTLVLTNYDSATGKEYQAHIAVGPDPDAPDPLYRMWYGLASFGRGASHSPGLTCGTPQVSHIMISRSSEFVIDRTNDRLDKKCSKGYTHPSHARGILYTDVTTAVQRLTDGLVVKHTTTPVSVGEKDLADLLD